MMAAECAREREIVAIVLNGRWAEDGCEELTMHAGQCEICRDVVTVATAPREDYDPARREVRVPAAGQVWWRAAVRARLEAAHAAARPLTWAHGVTGAAAAGMAVAGAGLAWPSVRQAFDWIGGRLSAVDPQTAAVATMITDTLQRSLPLAIGIAACLVLAPIALYWALSDE